MNVPITTANQDITTGYLTNDINIAITTVQEIKKTHPRASQDTATDSFTTDLSMATTTTRDIKPTRPGASQEITAESLTESPELTITANSNIFGTDSLFQQSTCSLASVITSIESCPPLQPSTETSSTLTTEVISTLLDDSFATCMRPFQFSSELRLGINISGTWDSNLLRIQITGRGLDCLYPSTLVYVDVRMASTHSIIKQECQFVGSNFHANLTLATCAYECHPVVLMEHPVPRFGVDLQRIAWLSSSQNLEQLCDIQAFMLIQWNLSVTTTSMMKFITCDLFSNVF